jgi:hypothetical protein
MEQHRRQLCFIRIGFLGMERMDHGFDYLSEHHLDQRLLQSKSFFKAAPILLGFIIGYVYALIIGLVDFHPIQNSDVVVFQSLGSLLGFYKYLHFDWSAIVMMVPLAFVTLMEHIGDISANSTICQKDFFLDPGIDKTLAGDGLAIMAASTLGGRRRRPMARIPRCWSSRRIMIPRIFSMLLYWRYSLAFSHGSEPLSPRSGCRHRRGFDHPLRHDQRVGFTHVD